MPRDRQGRCQGGIGRYLAEKDNSDRLILSFFDFGMLYLIDEDIDFLAGTYK